MFSIILLAVAFYFVLGREADSYVTRQLLSKQQVIARAEVSNATFFFEKFGNSVATLAQLSSIENNDPNAIHDLDKFVEQRSNTGLIGGVVIADKNGVVYLNSNVLRTRDIGQSVADRDYFVWAKNEGKRGQYLISKPVISRMGASKGQTIIAVTSPVYKGSVFTGVIGASVKLQPLVERFFGLMRLSDETKVYLFDEQGVLLYGNFAPEVAGSNMSELFSDDQSLSEKIKNALSADKEGEIETEKNLVTYSPLTLGKQKWLLVLSSPHQQVDNLTGPIHFRQTAILALVSVTILIFGIIAVRGNRV